MNDKLLLIFAIPILVVLTTATAYGIGYEINKFKVESSPGESVDLFRVILADKDTSLGISFIGEGNDWFTLTNNNTALSEKRVNIPFTLMIPTDVESAGDYMACMTVEQKSDSEGIIKINAKLLIPIIVTVIDPDKPQREELTFDLDIVEEKCQSEEVNSESVEISNVEVKEIKEKYILEKQIELEKQMELERQMELEKQLAMNDSKNTNNSEITCDPGTINVDGICKTEKSWSDSLLESINNFVDWIKNLF